MLGVRAMVGLDSGKAAVTRVLAGRDRIESERFSFDAFFCEAGIAVAHEKGVVWPERSERLMPLTRRPTLSTHTGNALLERLSRRVHDVPARALRAWMRAAVLHGVSLSSSVGAHTYSAQRVRRDEPRQLMRWHHE